MLRLDLYLTSERNGREGSYGPQPCMCYRYNGLRRIVACSYIGLSGLNGHPARPDRIPFGMTLSHFHYLLICLLGGFHSRIDVMGGDEIGVSGPSVRSHRPRSFTLACCHELTAKSTPNRPSPASYPSGATPIAAAYDGY
jgi:hypothetical protein